MVLVGYAQSRFVWRVRCLSGPRPRLPDHGSSSDKLRPLPSPPDRHAADATRLTPVASRPRGEAESAPFSARSARAAPRARSSRTASPACSPLPVEHMSSSGRVPCRRIDPVTLRHPLLRAGALCTRPCHHPPSAAAAALLPASAAIQSIHARWPAVCRGLGCRAGLRGDRGGGRVHAPHNRPTQHRAADRDAGAPWRAEWRDPRCV